MHRSLIRHASLAILLCLTWLLGGCGQDDRLAQLEEAVTQLQDNLQQRRTQAVLQQLHDEFQTHAGQDRQWAQQTMRLVFLRHRQIAVLAPLRQSRLDPTYSTRGHTRADVALSGAEGLLPDSARLYQVELEWWYEDGRWQLARLHWE